MTTIQLGKNSAETTCEFTRRFREQLKELKNPYPPGRVGADAWDTAIEAAEKAFEAARGESNLVTETAALAALNTLKGYCATVIDDHKKDTYSLGDLVLPQEVAEAWGKELQSVDTVDFLTEAAADERAAA